MRDVPLKPPAFDTRTIDRIMLAIVVFLIMGFISATTWLLFLR